MAGSANHLNSKYDSAYYNSENENRLLGRLLTLGQTCGIISVCLYGPDIPMEQSGIVLFAIFCIFCIFRIELHIVVSPCITGHAERLAILKSSAWYSLTDEELDEILSCNDQPVLEGYVYNLFKSAVRL